MTEKFVLFFILEGILLDRFLSDKYQLRRQRLRTMKVSVAEGCFAMVAIGLNATFYLPYLTKLGASSFQLGLVVSLSSFLTGAIQFIGPALITKITSLKKLAVYSIAAHALCYLPLAFLHYVLPDGRAVWPAIIATSIASLAMGLFIAPWSDWIGHIVPRKRRGRYFAMRNRSTLTAQLLATFIIAQAFDMSADGKMMVFSILWIVCFIARIISAATFLFHYEPQQTKTGIKNPMSPVRFFHEHLKSSFGKFVLSVSLMYFAINLSSPFYAMHILDDLKFSYIQYSVILMMPSIVYILAIGIWGRICDHTGHVIPMKFSCILIAAAPLIWVFTSNFWLLLANQVFFGIASSGYYLAVFNHALDSLKDEDRASSLSYMNGLAMFSMSAAALIGGVILPHIPAIFGSQIRTIFALSILASLCSILAAQMVEQGKSQKLDMSSLQRILIGPYQRTGLFRAVFGWIRRPF